MPSPASPARDISTINLVSLTCPLREVVLKSHLSNINVLQWASSSCAAANRLGTHLYGLVIETSFPLSYEHPESENDGMVCINGGLFTMKTSLLLN